MEGLPPELKLELMQRLDNFCSLSTLIHAIPSFYHVLVHAKLTVLSSILKTAIQLPVVSDALTVLESSKLSNATSEEVRTILQNYKHGLENEHTTVLIEPSSSLATCVDIVRKHRLIEWFRQDLCRSNLPTPPLTNPQEPTDPLPVSTEENTRIYRALYRFELYCNLFRDANLYRLNTYEARTRLLKLWPSWEVEELSCIHNYLSRRLSEVLDEVAEHDVETGGFYHNVGKDRLYINETKEYVLSLGLRFLQRLLMLPTYEAQKEVLSDHRGSDMEFLGCALRMGAYDLEESDEEMADVDSTLKTAGPLTSRGSLGPNDAWLWAYHSEGYMRDYHAPNKLDLREWCYCLWDRRRLSACGILSTPWSEERHYQWIKVVKQECNRRFEENARSLKERSDITMMDGAGYWTKDWSKIIWPSDHSPCRKLTVPREYEYIVDWRPRKL